MLFHSHVRPRRRQSHKPFHFLAIGKLEQRKGYAELLEAFAAAFAGRADTRLIIKADFFAEQHGRRDALKALIAGEPLIARQVKIVSGRLTRSDLALLYGFADAFVFPSRAEGWGLPLIEALAAGVPAITTDCSGHGHYLAGVRDLVSVIAHDQVEIDDEDFARHWPDAAGGLGQWARPDVDSLAAKMHEVREGHDEAQARAFSASEIIRRDFSWSNSAHTALARLRERGWLEDAFQIDLALD